MLLLGIDAGTSVIKCALFDLSGEEVTVVRRKIPFRSPQLGWAEHDMDNVQEATFSAIKEAINLGEAKGETVAAVGITGQSAGTFIVDRDMRPVKAILWRDQRAKSLVQEWSKAGLDRRFQELTGWPLLPDFAPVQLAWLKKYEPDTLARARWIIGGIDWLAYHLTSDLRVVSTAMVTCINPRDRTYDKTILDLLNVSECESLFPTDLVDPWEIVGVVSDRASSLTGLKKGTPVVSAGYDQTCNTLGAGGVSRGDAVTVLGTAGGNALVVDKYTPPDGTLISCTPHAAPNRWIMLGESHTATLNLDWFISQFCREESKEAEKRDISVHKVCEEKIRDIPVASGGIIYQPFLYGEVSPFFEPNAKSSFFGIKGDQTKYHLMRSVYEGVGYSIKDNYDAILELTKTKLQSITLAGGGAKSELWAQMIADINGCEVYVTNAAEIGAKGAAICAAKAVNIFTSVEEAARSLVQTKNTFLPDISAAKSYQKAYMAYRNLRRILVPIWNM